MFTVGIIVASDKGSKGDRVDESGKLIIEIMQKNNYDVMEYIILPDELNLIEETLISWSDNLKLDLIVTTGGTGFSPRDITPEATKRVIDKETPGISEAIRAMSLKITPRAMLSRAASGIREKSLIINLPGSPVAVQESLDFILPTLIHGLEIMTEKTSDCAR